MKRFTGTTPAMVFFAAGAAVIGLASGASPSKAPFTSGQKTYWAFQKVRRPAVPDVTHREWVRNPIDAFVLRKLEQKEIEPGGAADKITLIRRATFDLIGLPPTPEEVQAFLQDGSLEAFQKVVGRLLDSPHYGERWGRHWLDLARFAESSGFEQDVTRPYAWRYRDYVIDSFNSDKPYDRFIREQIAGDELWPDDPRARIATGFNRHYPEEGNIKDLLQARQETLHDITDVVGSTFLGLTFNCARCHDHKFDPILQKDYYRLQAFFANIGPNDHFPLVSGEQLAEYERQLAHWEEKTQAIWDEMSAVLMSKRGYSPEQLLSRYPDFVIAAVEKAPAERTPLEAQMVYLLQAKDCRTCALRPKPYRDPFFRQPAEKLEGKDKERYEQLEAELEKLAHLKPEEIPRGTGITDIGRDAPATHVLGVGLHTAPKEEVQPGFLSILDPGPARVTRPENLNSTGRRTALASWLADPENPLTGRVMVNRIWHHHFGKGIVVSPSDFGRMGDRPTHPELLDWLTDEFARSGWSVKHVHRLIMTSSTYRQSATDRQEGRQVDPFNRLLWRYPPRRVEAEAIRDSALAVAGLLNPQVGGPSVFPPLPPGMPKPMGGWDTTDLPADQHRRSIYIFVRRNVRYPMLESFDFPDTHETCARRETTTTAPQALTLLNSAFTAEWARAFAARVLSTAEADVARQVETAYELAYSRKPDAWEKDKALTFFDRQGEIIAKQAADGKDIVLPASVPEGVKKEHAAALVDYSLMLLNSNEFVYRF